MQQGPGEAIDRHKTYLDPLFLDRARLRTGLGAKDYADALGMDYRTLRDILEGRGVNPSTAKELARKLNVKDLLTLLAPWDPRVRTPCWSTRSLVAVLGLGSARSSGTGPAHTNGLYYIVCHMRHQHTGGKQGRGKFYHLFWVRAEMRDDIRHQLSRHADVCALVGIHANVAVNLTSTPVAHHDGWWVIDDWVGKGSLADHLRGGPWPRETLPRLLYEIAQGLGALHAAGVVFRELAPSRVLISEKDGRAVLTDFELAKLLDGSPSVSDEWPEDPFRAPEVEGKTVTAQADLYSLAHLAAACLAGLKRDYDPGKAAKVLEKASLPKGASRLLLDCLEPIPAKHQPTCQ